jgi:hypothetical protein
MSKEIRFNAFAMNCVGHMAPGLWRHPRDRSDRYIDLNHWTGLARSPASTRAIPELAPQWKKLDLAEILTRPAAFVSISQNKSLYETWGAQGSEKHRERGSLPATIKVVNAARAAQNFKSFSWIGGGSFCEGASTIQPARCSLTGFRSSRKMNGITWSSRLSKGARPV